MKRIVGYCVVAVVVLLACNKNSSVNTTGQILFIQASPDAPALDVYLDGKIFLQNLSYGPDTAKYNFLNAGNYKMQIAPAGTTNYSSTAIFNINPSKQYSLFTIDSVSSLTVAAVEDNFTIPNADTCLIRFFHFSPNTYAVDASIQYPVPDTIITPIDTVNGVIQYDTSINSGFTLLGYNRKFNDQATSNSYTSFTTITAGTYRYLVYNTGTANPALMDTTFAFQGGKVYTFYLKGFQDTTTHKVHTGIIIHNQ
jgi:hypothetical protein